jgi:DNA-binding MarR family transcriptional regulator
MKSSRVRKFRQMLRRFERINQVLNASCCGEITMAQCHVLMEIELMGEVTTKELAEKLLLDKSTLSRTVNKLCSIGLVSRRSNKSDRRFVFLSLTARGRKRCDEINRGNDQIYRQVFNYMPSRTAENMIHHFESLVESMYEYKQSIKGTASCCGGGEV